MVDQQAAHIEHHTTLKVGRMHGHLNSDIWSDRSKFNTFIAEHHVRRSTSGCDLLPDFFRAERNGKIGGERGRDERGEGDLELDFFN